MVDSENTSYQGQITQVPKMIQLQDQWFSPEVDFPPKGTFGTLCGHLSDCPEGGVKVGVTGMN